MAENSDRSSAVSDTLGEMTEPLEWQRVPTTGVDLGLRCYRTHVDGQGWMVVFLRQSVDDLATAMTKAARGEILSPVVASMFVPDPNGMWGVALEAPERKSRWD